MNILVIQLTRMGDIVQSSALISELKKHYANSHIDIVCNEINMPLCQKMEPIRYVFPLALTRLIEAKDWLLFHKCLKELKTQNYDMIFNLNSSKISSIIANYISTEKEKICGHYYDPIKNESVADPWWKLIKSFVRNRKFSPLNIVEAFKYTLMNNNGIASPIFPSKQLHSKNIQKGSVGIVLGAGSKKRIYPLTYFSELLHQLLGYGFGPIYILGGCTELASSRLLERKVNSSSVINLVGKTNLLELMQLLASLDLVIGSDTGPLHLAAALGCKVLGLYFGPAWFSETGPFGKGHYVVQSFAHCTPCSEDTNCPSRYCRTLIKPKVVFDIAKGILANESYNVPHDCLVIKSTETNGSFLYEPVGEYLSPELEEIITTINIYRCIIRNTFDIPLGIRKIGFLKDHIIQLSNFVKVIQHSQLPNKNSAFIRPFIAWLTSLHHQEKYYANLLSEAIYSTLGVLDE